MDLPSFLADGIGFVTIPIIILWVVSPMHVYRQGGRCGYGICIWSLTQSVSSSSLPTVWMIEWLSNGIHYKIMLWKVIKFRMLVWYTRLFRNGTRDSQLPSFGSGTALLLLFWTILLGLSRLFARLSGSVLNARRCLIKPSFIVCITTIDVIFDAFAH